MYSKIGISISLVFALILLGCESKSKIKETQKAAFPASARVLQIDRSDSAQFSPVAFVGDEFTLPNEQPEALAIKQISISAIECTEMVDGTYDNAYRRFTYEKKIGLDAKILETFWKHKDLIPEAWKKTVDGQPMKIFFMGSTLMNSAGDKCLLYVYWHNGWYWDFEWFDAQMSHNCYAAFVSR